MFSIVRVRRSATLRSALLLVLLLFSGSIFANNEANSLSPYHHVDNGFINPENSYKRSVSTFQRMNFFRKFLWRGLIDRVPKDLSGHVIDNAVASQLLNSFDDRDSISWVGHSTFLVRLGGVNILTDPVFSQRVSPFSFLGPRRKVSLGLEISDLPSIDVVIVSHAHYDHLDTKTLDLLPNKSGITVIVPLGLGKYFTKRDYGKVYEVDWYDNVQVGELSVTAYPAIHWSNRTPFDVNKSLWMSYGFSLGGVSIFHTGDTGVHNQVFKDIGSHMLKKYGGCDIGLMSIGAYDPREFMRGAHMDPEEGFEVGKQVGCKKMIPMHWGTFKLSFEPFYEPRDRFVSAAGSMARVLKIGETIPISKSFDY
jgi:L-ascorbate metabolism protein UlaG (beta-lactamase superfamily)